MRAWVVLMVVGWAGACGSGGNTGPNRGAQCTQVLEAVCDRAGGDCQIIPASGIGACVQSGVVSCCAGNGDCSTPVISTQADIDTCIADVDAASCATLDIYTGGTLPASCQGVVRSAHKSVNESVTSALSGVGVSPLGTRVGGLLSR
jgi:hypothetical protein